MDSATKRTIEEKRRKLSELLVELAQNEELLAKPSEKHKIYQRMENIYNNDHDEKPFRHFYSDFFPKLVEIKNNVALGNIDVLAANLRGLMYGYQAQNLDENGEIIDIEDEIIKLYDHINLDVARLNHFTQTFSKTERSLEELEEDSKKAKEEIKKAKKCRTKLYNYSWHFCINCFGVYRRTGIFNICAGKHTRCEPISVGVCCGSTSIYIYKCDIYPYMVHPKGT